MNRGMACVLFGCVASIASCGSSDSVSQQTDPTTAAPAARDSDLCSLAADPLPGSNDKPASSAELAESLQVRAERLATIAADQSPALADALRVSAAALSEAAAAITASDSSESAFVDTIDELMNDAKVSEAQTVIDAAVDQQCGGLSS